MPGGAAAALRESLERVEAELGYVDEWIANLRDDAKYEEPIFAAWKELQEARRAVGRAVEELR
jgi:hypothetical protein